MANCSCVCMQLGCIGCLTWHYYDSPQSALLLRRVAFIRAVLIDSTIHPLGRFFASSVLYAFYRWSISFARDLHRLPIVAKHVLLHQYHQQLFLRTTCSSFSHGTAQFLFRSLFLSLYFAGDILLLLPAITSKLA